MKDIAKLTEISAKKSFKILRGNGPYFCNILENKEVEITNLYFRHISGGNTKRTLKEKILRLLIIPFIGEILKNGELTEKRENPIIEKKRYKNSFRISFKIETKTLIIIIAEKANGKFILISSFVEY